MKAICNGDSEVGKMLYSMAVTFRSQLKEADIITLAQELHYCKKYLELFEYRYPSQFKSSVDCPLEYMQIPIIKFVLQPIIENYFIHEIPDILSHSVQNPQTHGIGSQYSLHPLIFSLHPVQSDHYQTAQNFHIPDH